ncbi:MAG: tyrosine-type recombinase/integrase, partial [archaeon]|nr:tyrosine-type recombinase/integrase [archaeon]
MDIHKRARKLQRALQRLDASSISEGNKDTIKQFECYLTQEEYSAGRRQKYVEQLTKIASWLDKPFKVASKPDIIDIMVKVGEQGYKEWTKHDYKVTLKVFFKWLRFGSIENDEYPEEVKWIKSRMKNSSRKLPEEILTEDEVQRMAEACTNSRDKAFILVLYDCGGRIGEILSLKIKDVTFDRYGAVLILDGKTGMRRVRIIASAPALSHWLSDHPLKNTSDAPLWTMFTEREKIKPVSYAAMRKVILEATRNAEPPIKKRVHPHLFRHSR